MNLPALRRELRRLIPKDGPCSFVCDGSPLNVDVLIIGTNMSTRVPFWECWDDDQGFLREEWRSRYARTRSGERNLVTPTRRIIDRIEDAVAPYRCLSMNVFATPSRRARDLPAELRDKRLFSFLVTNGRARAIILSGKEAASSLSEVLAGKLVGRAIFPVPHFSRGWSYRDATKLGNAVRTACDWINKTSVAAPTPRSRK